MAFSPTIIVNYDDLLARKEDIDRAALRCDSKGVAELYEKIQRLFVEKPIVFEKRRAYWFQKGRRDRIRILLIEESLTWRNATIREVFDHLEIEYQIDI